MLKDHSISPSGKILTGAFILCILLVVSCSTAPAASTPTPTTQVLPATVTTTTSQTETPESLPPTKLSTSVSGSSQVLLFDDWPKDGFPTDATKITAITLERDILKIQVDYQGGCQEHTFALHAWTGFLLSNPPQGELYLSHDAHGDTCTKNVENLLSFDLTPLDKSRAARHANPLMLRIYEPAGGSFANEPFMPLIEWS